MFVLFPNKKSSQQWRLTDFFFGKNPTDHPGWGNPRSVCAIGWIFFIRIICVIFCFYL